MVTASRLLRSCGRRCLRRLWWPPGRLTTGCRCRQLSGRLTTHLVDGLPIRGGSGGNGGSGGGCRCCVSALAVCSGVVVIVVFVIVFVFVVVVVVVAVVVVAVGFVFSLDALF